MLGGSEIRGLAALRKMLILWIRSTADYLGGFFLNISGATYYEVTGEVLDLGFLLLRV